MLNVIVSLFLIFTPSLLIPNFLNPSPSEMTARTERIIKMAIAVRGVTMRREDGIVCGVHQNEGGGARTNVPNER